MNISYPEFCIFVSFPHLFIYSSIYIRRTHEYLVYTLDYNPLLHYLSWCSNCSSFGHWVFLQVDFSFPFDTLPTHSHRFGFGALLYFLTLKDAPSSSCIFPAPALESAIYSRSGSFHSRMVLETNQDVGKRRDFCWLWILPLYVFT